MNSFLNKPRPCGCKGCRTCLICESDYGITQRLEINKNDGAYVYCPLCNKAWPGWDLNTYTDHPTHYAEEDSLVRHIDQMPWDLSQSGRRKQNFGPKCNFKKKKLQVGDFKGFPLFSKFVQDKFKNEPILENFLTVEQCSLEYTPEKGASIDPHIDDCWIWGERIVSVNVLSDSVLTMTFNKNPHRYNLDCVAHYPRVLNNSGYVNLTAENYKVSSDVRDNYPIIRIPMPRRSLLVLYGAARYDWEHRVMREDIIKRRICLAYREFTPPYISGGSMYEKGKVVLEKATNFFVEVT